MQAEDYLKQIIKQNANKINISRFMSEVLCNPKFGYYTTSNPIGNKGDFITSPEISQMFGELIGAWCAYVWQQKNDAKDYILVELGAGKGTMMSDMLRATKHVNGFHEVIEVHIVEISPELTKIQKSNLAEYSNIKWHKSIQNLPDKPMILVANEFFDALPVNQYVKKKDNWFEKFVSLRDDKFCFVLEQNFISKQLDKTYSNECEDSVYELSIASDAVMEIIADKITNNGGGALIIDYGYSEQKFKNSLQAVKNHKFCDIFTNIAQADVTTHVNFQQLIDSIKKHQIKNFNLMTQGDFLNLLGIEQRANQLISNAKTDVAKFEIKSAKSRLVDADKMGKLFKVLSFVK